MFFLKNNRSLNCNRRLNLISVYYSTSLLSYNQTLIKRRQSMNDVYIVGVGMTPFGRFLERSLTHLTEEAVGLALRDAGLSHADIGAISFANATQGAIEGQFGIRGQVALSGLAFDGVPMINVENACASASTALQIAMTQIQAGQVDIALAIGAEKMCHTDSALSMSAFQGSWDRANSDNTVGRLDAMSASVPTPEQEAERK